MLFRSQSTPAPFEHSLAVPEPAPATLEHAPTEPEVGTGREPALDALDDPEEIPVVSRHCTTLLKVRRRKSLDSCTLYFMPML